MRKGEVIARYGVKEVKMSKRSVRQDAGEDALGTFRERRRAKVYSAYEEAAADVGFVAEQHEIVAAFDAALLDGMAGDENQP